MLETFRPLIEAASGLDLHDPAVAQAALRQRFDPAGEQATALNAALESLLAEGALANRGELPVMWSRVAKASDETGDLSIDVVRMTGPGPRHRHPAGEVNYCIAREGTPTFDGSPAGWVVKAPDSEHVPTVAGGEMLIVYLLPRGEMEFLK
jgi:Domain of unknown function (DUF4863)